MLLAKTNDTAWKLRNMFKERQVIKKYWVITKGVPNPKEGIIDIPIVETEVSHLKYHVIMRKSRIVMIGISVSDNRCK